MRRNQWLSMVGIVGAIISIAYILYISNQNAIENFSGVFGSKLSFQSKQKPASLPTHIIIPTIHVDANVEYVGLTKAGVIDVPKGPNNAGWFDQSPIPGEKGNTIVDGHSGFKNDVPAVFDNLYKLKKGDKIYVKNESGDITTFLVTKLKSYDKDANPKEVLSSGDTASHLNLITCAGDWNALEKTHSKRLVVFADKLEEVH